MDEVKSMFSSPAFAARPEHLVRPGFADDSTWEDIIGLLEESEGSALDCARPKDSDQNQHKK